jgi:hypothetical protein
MVNEVNNDNCSSASNGAACRPTPIIVRLTANQMTIHEESENKYRVTNLTQAWSKMVYRYIY